MITVSRKKADLFLRMLFGNLGQLQKDRDLLARWARMRKLRPAGKLALLFQNGIENLRADLVSLRQLLEQTPAAADAKGNRKVFTHPE
ncbi:MAG: hypothetical protein HY541_05270 [Deltaproteobacteria bacterium]|nr:hypothetical protein [Deltaproteobacteria bacterium]